MAKNITLAVEEDVLDAVRIVAAERKTTVNALVRDYLGQMARGRQRLKQIKRELREMSAASKVWPGREALYEERMNELLYRRERSRVRGNRGAD
jgi:Family of unknown function (DUF6364)